MSRAIAVDTSACVAILLGEPESEALARALGDAEELWMGTFSVLETSVVIGVKKGPRGMMAWDAMRERLQIHEVPMSAAHADLAREAWIRFGKGRHPAGLNLGDCCAYATARHAGLPLLFKGDDFARTDIEPVRLR